MNLFLLLYSSNSFLKNYKTVWNNELQLTQKFHTLLQILEHCAILYIELLEKKKLKAWQGGLIQLTFNYKSAHQSFVKC